MRAGQQAPPRLGEGSGMRAAVDQGTAGDLFQLLDQAREFGRRHIQGLRRTAEVQVLRQRRKGAQHARVQVHGGAHSAACPVHAWG